MQFCTGLARPVLMVEGGPDREPSTRRAVSGIAVVDLDTKEVAFSFSRVLWVADCPQGRVMGITSCVEAYEN